MYCANTKIKLNEVKMTGNLHLLLAHVADWIEWIQTEYGIPPGCATESTLELGHQHVKRNQTRFSRLCSYIAENHDILVHLGWLSDPLLLWEKDIGQKIKPGNTRKAKAEAKLRNWSSEEENMDGVELAEEDEGDMPFVPVAFPEPEEMEV